jgi:putative ABC transport system substrate-binding protein
LRIRFWRISERFSPRICCSTDFHAYRECAVAGGLLANVTSYYDIFRRQATFVDAIFRGAKPGDLPIEHPTKFEFVINLKTAKALGLDVPPSLLVRANRLIE